MCLETQRRRRIRPPLHQSQEGRRVGAPLPAPAASSSAGASQMPHAPPPEEEEEMLGWEDQAGPSGILPPPRNILQLEEEEESSEEDTPLLPEEGPFRQVELEGGWAEDLEDLLHGTSNSALQLGIWATHSPREEQGKSIAHVGGEEEEEEEQQAECPHVKVVRLLSPSSSSHPDMGKKGECVAPKPRQEAEGREAGAAGGSAKEVAPSRSGKRTALAFASTEEEEEEDDPRPIRRVATHTRGPQQPGTGDHQLEQRLAQMDAKLDQLMVLVAGLSRAYDEWRQQQQREGSHPPQ